MPRLSLFAVCLTSALAFVFAVALASGRPAAGTTGALCPTPVTVTPTPDPSVSPYPTITPLYFCNNTGRSVDGLEAFLTSPYQHVGATLIRRPEACGDPSLSSNETAPDFTSQITVSWPTACVASPELVELSWTCAQTPSSAPSTCPLQAAACAGWTLAGKPVGQP